MPETVHSLSTSGLSPREQIQRWSDALTDLCGRFDVDPLEASSLEGRINYTTVSSLKLCQIEASQHRIGHTDSRIRSTAHPYIKILFQTVGISYFEQDGRRIEVTPGDCLGRFLRKLVTLLGDQHQLADTPGYAHVKRSAQFFRSKPTAAEPVTNAYAATRHKRDPPAFDRAGPDAPDDPPF